MEHRQQHAHALDTSQHLSTVPALQRQCACGGAAGPSGECTTCRQQRLTVQPKLAVNQPGDRYEQAADQMAAQVMRMDETAGLPRQQQPTPVLATGQADSGLAVDGGFAQRLQQRQGGGVPLPTAVRTFMEARMGTDFTQVRVHTDHEAQAMSHQIQAQAFTHGQEIYYGAGKVPGNDSLTAHELTHVMQQTAATHTPAIQRVLEVRPPGRGEASAFDRRQELIDRLNTLSAAIQYRLDDRRILYDVIDEAALTHFDRQMMALIDRAEILPMRLITSQGRVSNGAGGFVPVIADSFVSGYVDLDDLLAADDLALQSILLHFLTERAAVPNYARRIGTNIFPLFNRAHELGHDAQAAHFQAILGDPSIRFNYEEIKPNGTAHIVFKSRTGGYRVFLIIRRIRGAVSSSEVLIHTSDQRWLSVANFLAERAAAPAAP